MKMRSLILIVAAMTLALVPGARAEDSWQETLGSIAIQDGGRVMPLDTYARRLAVELTGRTSWSQSNGPDAFKGRQAIELLADLIFTPDEMMNKAFVLIDHRGLKTEVGL